MTCAERWQLRVMHQRPSAVNDALRVFPFADDYTFGVLQSAFHWVWFVNRCSTPKGSHPSVEQCVQQWVLNIGVWARPQMEKDSSSSEKLMARFPASERNRESRRKTL